MTRGRLGGEAAKFLVVGGTCAAINVGLGTVVRFALGVKGHALGVAAGFVAGTIASFVLNREITFAARRDPLGVQALRFLLLAATGILLAVVVGEVALRVAVAAAGAAAPQQVLASGAHVTAIAVTTVYNFVGMKFFALRR